MAQINNPTAPLLTESDGLLGKARNMLTYLKERGLGEPMMVRDLCNELERKQTENAALREQLAQAEKERDDLRAAKPDCWPDMAAVNREFAANSMRSLCVEKVKNRAAKRLKEAAEVEDSDHEYSRALECAGDQLNEAAGDLQSLTLDQVEQKRASRC